VRNHPPENAGSSGNQTGLWCPLVPIAAASSSWVKRRSGVERGAWRRSPFRRSISRRTVADKVMNVANEWEPRRP